LSLETDVRRLSAVRPFDALPREALQLLAFSCQKRALKAGETLFAVGDAAADAYFVLEGELVLRRPDAERRVREGALVGQSALLVETIRISDATAAGETLLLRIPGETFRRVLSEFPRSAVSMHRAAKSQARALIVALERVRRSAFVGA
jgi:CRP-like cAMP-binding protein